MSRRAQDHALAVARPRPLRRPLRERLWSAFRFARAHELPLLAAWLAGAVLTSWWAVLDPVYRPLVWLCINAGVQMLTIGAWIALDVHRRAASHDRSGLVAVGGWRIAAPVGDLDPDLLLSVSLVAYLYDHAKLTQTPIRGRHRRSRTTYASSLRTLARIWGRSSAVSGRRADALLARELCDRYGLVRRVPVGQAEAYRLVDESLPCALARLEQAAGVRLIAWSLGRDPRSAAAR